MSNGWLLAGAAKARQSVTSEWEHTGPWIEGAMLREVKNVLAPDGVLVEVFRQDWQLGGEVAQVRVPGQAAGAARMAGRSAEESRPAAEASRRGFAGPESIGGVPRRTRTAGKNPHKTTQKTKRLVRVGSWPASGIDTGVRAHRTVRCRAGRPRAAGPGCP